MQRGQNTYQKTQVISSLENRDVANCKVTLKSRAKIDVLICYQKVFLDVFSLAV